MGRLIQNFARNRNTGCRITLNLLIGEIPTVVIENELIRMTILAGRGADVVEFLYKPIDMDFVWLTNNGIPTKKVPDLHPNDVDSFRYFQFDTKAGINSQCITSHSAF